MFLITQGYGGANPSKVMLEGYGSFAGGGGGGGSVATRIGRMSGVRGSGKQSIGRGIST